MSELMAERLKLIKNHPSVQIGATWITKVPKTILQKMRLLKMPSKTLRSPWILRALISLNSCISTNVLKTMV